MVPTLNTPASIRLYHYTMIAIIFICGVLLVYWGSRGALPGGLGPMPILTHIGDPLWGSILQRSAMIIGGLALMTIAGNETPKVTGSNSNPNPTRPA